MTSLPERDGAERGKPIADELRAALTHARRALFALEGALHADHDGDRAEVYGMRCALGHMIDRIAARAATPAAPILTTGCAHASLHNGPRVPGLYCSFGTEVCDACGAWRIVGYHLRPWNPLDSLEATCLDVDEERQDPMWYRAQWEAYVARRKAPRG